MSCTISNSCFLLCKNFRICYNGQILSSIVEKVKKFIVIFDRLSLSNTFLLKETFINLKFSIISIAISKNLFKIVLIFFVFYELTICIPQYFFIKNKFKHIKYFLYYVFMNF